MMTHPWHDITPGENLMTMIDTGRRDHKIMAVAIDDPEHQGLYDLRELLASAASQGQLTVTEHQQQVQSYDDAKRALGIALPEALTRLARSALLVA